MNIEYDSIKQLFISTLKERLDLDVADIDVTPRSESYFSAGKNNREVPYLDLLTIGDSYERIIGDPPRMGLVSDEVYMDIRTAWREATRELGPEYHEKYNELYDPKMYIGVDRYETKCYIDFAYHYKDDVLRYLIRKLGKAPRDIYSSTVPGLNIVYETPDYNALRIGEIEDELRRNILAMAKNAMGEKYGFDIECNLKVSFYHPEMPNYNGYGLARQD